MIQSQCAVYFHSFIIKVLSIEVGNPRVKTGRGAAGSTKISVRWSVQCNHSDPLLKRAELLSGRQTVKHVRPHQQAEWLNIFPFWYETFSKKQHVKRDKSCLNVSAGEIRTTYICSPQQAATGELWVIRNTLFLHWMKQTPDDPVELF